MLWGRGGCVCTSRISKRGDEPGEEQRCSGPGSRSGGTQLERARGIGTKRIKFDVRRAERRMALITKLIAEDRLPVSLSEGEGFS